MRLGGRHYHVCVRDARIHRVCYTRLYTEARRSATDRWTSGLTRTWCATRRRPREYSECARGSSEDLHACVRTCVRKSVLCIEERVKGLIYLQRHVLKASRHGGIIYIGLSKVEIHLMHFCTEPKLIDKQILIKREFWLNQITLTETI